MTTEPQQGCPHMGPRSLPPAFGEDPYTFFDELRASGSVHQIRLPDGTMSWWVTRYQDIDAALDDWQTFSSEVHHAVADAEIQNSQALIRKDETLRYTMINRNPPDHSRMRKLVVRAFSATRIDGLRPRIQELADELLDDLAQRPSVDLVEDYAFPLPVGVICELLGVPRADIDYYGALVTKLVGAATPQDGKDAIAELKDFIGKKLNDKRANPGDDVFTAMVQAADEGLLSEPELPAMGLQLLTAGHETSIYMISGGVLRLLENPDQLAKLREDPGLVPAAVDELLRYDPPPVPGVFRYATRDVEIDGTTIPEGALVILCLASGNRDTDKFSCPEKLDITREDNPHMAFGGGVHYCLGARLARLEGEIAIGTLLRRFPDLEPVVPLDQIRHRPLNFLQRLESLPVRLR
ncbi:cytochrome P450 family protein [Streptomyces sp. URMC 129]|uniref:cytochrome P450 family protein n=1 Tax=Streptomyces sp. URMC 129 TaxID=3423407 RepID=UPI003F1A5068